MSAENHLRILQDLERELRASNLTGFTFITELQGRKFTFVSEFGSHTEVLVGTITSVHMGDGEVSFEVSSRYFFGVQLKNIMHTDRGWEAQIDTNEAPERRFFPGKLEVY